MEKLTTEKVEQVFSFFKKGNDYPRLVQGLKKAGVSKYTFDIKTALDVYYGHNGEQVTMHYPKELTPAIVATQASAEQLKDVLTKHQKGETDFVTFYAQAAAAGVNKWTADLEQMAVIYYDINAAAMLSEPIPVVEY